MTDSAPLVSFIIPAFNAVDTLDATLESLVAQTDPRWEAVIVDDGSRDRTFTLARRWSARDPRVRALRQRNAGASAARNTAMTAARGRFVAFLDADDWLEADYLATLLPLAEDGRAIAYCAYRRILPSGRPGPSDWCPELEHDALGVLSRRCEPAIHCVIAPRALVLDVGGFDETLRTCEDWDLWLRLARTGIPFRGTPRPLANYRMRAFSLSTERPEHGADAQRVLTLALGPDPRLPEGLAGAAPCWDAAPEQRMERAVAAQVEAVARGDAPDADWLEQAFGADWRAASLCDPVAIFAAVQRAASARDADPEPITDALIASARQRDPAIAESLCDHRDLMHVKQAAAHGGGGRAGRWVSVSLDPAALPLAIVPQHGCDAIVLRIADTPHEFAMPLTEPLMRATIGDLLLRNIAVGELARLSRAWRSPTFLARLAGEMMRIVPRRAGAMLRDRALARAAFGTILRRALSRHLGTRFSGTEPRTGEVPVLLFNRIVPGTSGLLAPDTGLDELAQIFALLDQEGYTAIAIADLVQARHQGAPLPERPVVLVFADAASFMAAKVERILPDTLARVEVLFTPAEIMAGLPFRLASAARVATGYGLRADTMPLPCAEALALARDWRSRLDALSPERPIAALSDTPGLADAVLIAAGFDALLSPGSAQARIDLPLRVVPAIECSGSEGVGTAIECLRPAA